MASLGHVAIGMAAGRAYGRRGRRAVVAMVALSAVSLLPDLDVVAFALDIPYAHAFGHRGASHSLAAALALGLLALAPPSESRLRTALFVTVVAASHSLLDALTDGGLGVALLWPFTSARFFAPWQPIPVAPIGANMLSARGLYVLGVEAVLFAPFFAYALWPRRSEV
jgi:inner membrane protein